MTVVSPGDMIVSSMTVVTNTVVGGRLIVLAGSMTVVTAVCPGMVTVLGSRVTVSVHVSVAVVVVVTVWTWFSVTVTGGSCKVTVLVTVLLGPEIADVEGSKVTVLAGSVVSSVTVTVEPGSCVTAVLVILDVTVETTVVGRMIESIEMTVEYKVVFK